MSYFGQIPYSNVFMILLSALASDLEEIRLRYYVYSDLLSIFSHERVNVIRGVSL